MQVPITDSPKSISSIKFLQDKVLGKLVSEMWPGVSIFPFLSEMLKHLYC